MILKNLKLSFVPKRLVTVPRSRQFCKLILLHAILHMYMKPHVFAEQLLSISYCRNSAYIRVLFWRHGRIGSILMRCFDNKKNKRNRMQFGNDLSNRTLLIWWNSFVEKNEKETLERLFNKQYVVVQALCLVIFQIT